MTGVMDHRVLGCRAHDTKSVSELEAHVLYDYDTIFYILYIEYYTLYAYIGPLLDPSLKAPRPLGPSSTQAPRLDSRTKPLRNSPEGHYFTYFWGLALYPL